MKVLHVGPVEPFPSTSGVSHSIRGTVSAEAEIGLDVGLLSSSPKASIKPLEKMPGVRLIAGPDRQHRNPWYISGDWIARIQKEFGKPDLVVFHSTYIPFHIALARRCRQLGWPYIVTPHGGISVGAQSTKKTKKFIGNILFFRSFVKQAVAVHAKSESSAEQIKSLFAVKHVFTIPNAVDEQLFDIGEHSAPANLGDFAAGADLILGFVGRINVHHKGIDLLLEATAILKSRADGPNCRLFMVGPFHTNKDRDYVLSTIKSLGLEDTVKLTGPKFDQEKWNYFLACDVFVHPSRYEAGIPIALLEAMALGRPCLATPGANMADVIREGGGWISEADPDAIADTIYNIYKSKETLPAVGKRLRDFARSRFTWRKVAEQESEEYARLCNPQTGIQ
jgi:glycosyltransferase involved in cell wall biosynthesis